MSVKYHSEKNQSSKLKICLLSGASTIHTVRWANAMAERGHVVHLVTMHPSKMDRINPDVVVHQLKVPAPLGYYANVFELKRLLGKVQPDLLHVHYASGYGTLARLVNFKPTMLSVWGSDVYLFPYESKRNEKVLRSNLKAASLITSTGIALKEQTELFINPTEPVEVVPFGIDTNLFKPISKRKDTDIVIGTVKRLKSVYGIDLLIQGVADLINHVKGTQYAELANRIKLLIVGEGPQLDELKDLSKQLNVDHCTEFVGAVPNEEVPEYINDLDIYCAFSRSESFGVAILEASACEVPVVVSNVGGLPEVVQDGETGFIINHENRNEIVKKLFELLIDREKREKFGHNGRAFVQSHYEWQRNVEEMETLYLNFIAN